METTGIIGDGAQTGANVSKPDGRRTPQKHGLSRLLKQRKQALARKLDGRSTAMQALKGYEASLIASLGGRDGLSQQELTVVELVARDQFILEQVDTFIMQRGMIHKRKRTLFPIAAQRQAITEGILRKLLALGLSRRSKPINSLASLLNASPESTQEVP